MTRIKYILMRSWPIFIIVLVGLAIYSNTFFSPIQFDDEIYIVNNTDIRSFSSLKEIFKTTSHAGRFVTFFTFALNYHFHYLDVFGYHLVNFLIHITNALLVCWLTILTLSAQSLKYEQISKHKKTIGLFVALVFLTHPLQTQAVTYLTQRFASLATLFYLSSVCFYVKARLRGGERFMHWGYMIFSILFGIIGMFTKEIVATLALSILLYELSFLSIGRVMHSLKNSINWYYLFPFFLITLIIPGIYSFKVMETLFDPRVSGTSIGDHVTAWTYLITQFKVIPVYLKLLFVPINQNLLYDFPLSVSLFDLWTLMGFILILGIIAFAAKIHYRYTIISFGILWIFVTLLVESSIIPIQHVIFEHRMYLPMVGFGFFLIAVLFHYIKDYGMFKNVVVVIICIFSVLTFLRNEVWKDDVSLWSDVVKKSPNQSRAFLNLGIAYMFDGKSQEALDNFGKSIQINPNSERVYKNRANVYAAIGEYQKAVEDYGRAIQISPKYAKAYSNRGVLYNEMQQFDLAIADYNMALKLDPTLAEVYNNRGFAYKTKAAYEYALKDFDMAIKLNPKYIKAYVNRADTYKSIGQYDLAIKDFTKSLQISPQNYSVYYNRASVYTLLGKYNLAIQDFNRFISVDPNTPVVYYSRSLVYQAKGDLRKAIKDAQKAKELGYPRIDAYIVQLQSMLR